MTNMTDFTNRTIDEPEHPEPVAGVLHVGDETSTFVTERDRDYTPAEAESFSPAQVREQRVAIAAARHALAAAGLTTYDLHAYMCALDALEHAREANAVVPEPGDEPVSAVTWREAICEWCGMELEDPRDGIIDLWNHADRMAARLRGEELLDAVPAATPSDWEAS